jgi:hypothetical protein
MIRALVAAAAMLLTGCLPVCDGPLTLWSAPPANTSSRTCDGGPCPRVTQLAATSGQACALTDTGAVWCWGSSTAWVDAAQWVQPQLLSGVTAIRITGRTGPGNSLTEGGYDSDNAESGMFALQAGAAPSWTGEPEDALIPPAAWRGAGVGELCDLDEGGTLRCRGAFCTGVDGNLILFTTYQSEMSTLPTPFKAARVVAGTGYVCLLSVEGAVACRGKGLGGELGTGRASGCETDFVATAGLTSAVTQIAAGAHHACAVLCDGSVRCWGTYTGDHLWIGGPNGGFGVSPRVIDGVGDVIQIAAGGNETCAVRRDGKLLCWTPPLQGPVVVRAIDSLSDVVEVAVGSDFRCVRKGDGTLWCMSNGRGYVPIGTEPTLIQF